VSVQQQAVLIVYPCKFLGNLLLALPHFKAILQDQRQVLLILDERYRDIADIFLPGETRILYYPRAALSARRGLVGRLRALGGFLGRLRQFKADLLLELEGESTSTTVSLLARARHKVGPFFTRRRWVFDELVQFPHLAEHRWYGMQALCRRAHGQTLQPGYAHGTFPPSLQQQVRQQLQSLGLDPRRPWVSIHVGASQDYKLWDPANFTAVIAGLRERGLQVVLIGAGEKDRRQAALVQHQGSGVVDVIDGLGLGELACVLHLSRAFIGNDSGPMHLAAACGTPTFALFGPTVDRIWAPLGDNARVLRGPVACDPRCRTITCVQDYACLRSLTAARVLDEVGTVLA
jgi:heptosyltransferase-3